MSGVTVGTLMKAATDAGFDLSPHLGGSASTNVVTAPSPPGAENALNAADPATSTTVVAPVASAPVLGAPFMQPVPFGPANLRPVPWLVDPLLITGDLTVLAGQGAGAKTVTAINLCVAIAAGRPAWGPYEIRPRADGGEQQVLYMSGEEDTNRVGLLVAASCQALQLNSAEGAAVARNLFVHDARESGWRLGAPRQGSREEIARSDEDQKRDSLRNAMAARSVSLVAMDTLAGLFTLPNENDNSTATELMNRLARVLREQGSAGLLVHHTPKATRETVAAHRGESTMVRGGGAITNSSRVALTITGLPLMEAAAMAATGANPEAVRRLDFVKINDRASPSPAFLEVTEQMVQVQDGSKQGVRAVRFIPGAAQAATGGLPQAVLNTAMRAIDAGAVLDGVRMPLSPGGGRNNSRDATGHIARALRSADPGLSEVHAAAVARQALEQLHSAGWVEVQEMPIPKQSGGKPNGKRTVKGLVTRWGLVPWARAADVSPDGDTGDAAGASDGGAAAAADTQDGT